MPAETYDIERFRRLIDINLTGTFLCAQAAGNWMIRQKTGGSIIFIASMSGHIVNWPQEQSCYNASKAGVIQLGKSLAAEWSKYNIRVSKSNLSQLSTFKVKKILTIHTRFYLPWLYGLVPKSLQFLETVPDFFCRYCFEPCPGPRGSKEDVVLPHPYEPSWKRR